MGAYLNLLLVALLAGGGMAAETGDDCTNVIISMSPCLDYITGNSSSSPSAGCCTQLSTVVRNNPRCLCQVLTGGGSSTLGINVNQTRALALPASCNVQTPPANRCTGVGSPAGSPPGTSGSRNSSRSGGGSSTNSTPSGATMTSMKLASPLLIAIPLVASSYVSTFMGC